MNPSLSVCLLLSEIDLWAFMLHSTQLIAHTIVSNCVCVPACLLVGRKIDLVSDILAPLAIGVSIQYRSLEEVILLLCAVSLVLFVVEVWSCLKVATDDVWNYGAR